MLTNLNRFLVLSVLLMDSLPSLYAQSEVQIQKECAAIFTKETSTLFVTKLDVEDLTGTWINYPRFCAFNDSYLPLIVPSSMDDILSFTSTNLSSMQGDLFQKWSDGTIDLVKRNKIEIDETFEESGSFECRVDNSTLSFEVPKRSSGPTSQYVCRLTKDKLRLECLILDWEEIKIFIKQNNT